MAKENKSEEKKALETVNLADVKAQVELMLKEAREEADKILAEAKAQSSGEMTEEQKQARAKREEYWNEFVEVKLFKDNNKYRDDVFVSVNGENCVIKRGERVKVKRKFAAVLENSDLQDFETSKLIEQKSEEFQKSDL